MSIPILKDSVPFHLGMKVVMENCREIETNEEDFEVEEVVLEGKTIFILSRKGGGFGYGINLLFSSQKTRIKYQLEIANRAKNNIDEIKKQIKDGIVPETIVGWEEVENLSFN